MLSIIIPTRGDQIRPWAPCLGCTAQPPLTSEILVFHWLSFLGIFLTSEAGTFGGDCSGDSLTEWYQLIEG